MDASLNNYLKSLIPNWNYNENPLDRVELNYPEEQPFNCLANKILSDMSKVSIEKPNHREEIIIQVFKLNALIKAYDFIENAARNKGISEVTINNLAYKEFTYYEGSLRRLGLENGLDEIEPFEDADNEFQRLSLFDVPKENIYETQIHKMVALVKTYLDDNKLNIDSRDMEGRTQFYMACRSGDLNKVKLLLSLGCDPNIPNNYGYTPLYAACFYGFDTVVEYLIRNHIVDLNSEHHLKFSPFNISLSNGHEKCAKILIETDVYCADINTRDEEGRTQFYMACRSGDLNKVKMLLSLDCDPNIPNNHGYTPLYVACFYGFDNVVEYLIRNHIVDLNSEHHLKYSPFNISLSKGHEKCAKILIDAGANFTIVDSDGCTSLYSASQKGFHTFVDVIAKSKKIDLNVTYKGFTSFLSALCNGHSECAKILLELGCDPNIPNLDGFTPFYIACRNGMTEIVDLLIKSGNVDPNIKCKDCPPIFTACEYGFDEIVSIIAKSKRANLNADYNGITPFSKAISRGHEKCARILMEAGVDINEQNKYGDTLFKSWVNKKDVEKAKILLSFGCNPNIPNLDGFTPFYMACSNGMTEIVDLLIKSGNVDPNIKCKDCPPIFTACEHGFDEIVSIIVNSQRANLNADYNGITPFSEAISSGHEKCARILMEAGVDINAQDASGNTLFHNIVLERKLEKAKMLLSFGCNPNIPDSAGYTPFYTACCSGMTEIVDLLLKSGKIDPNTRTQNCPPITSACDHGFDKIVSIIAKSKRANLNALYNGQTPFTMAIYKGHKDCARILVEEGADVTFNINNNKTPLLLACEFGFEEVASLIAQRKQIDVHTKQLDLHNIAIMFERAKIKLNGNFFSQHNYNFANINNFLKSLNDNDEHVLRKETLDSFCSSIVVSLKNGTFKEFKNFLNFGKNLYESTIKYVIDFLNLEMDEPIFNIMERYKQILPVEIENVGGLRKLDKLKLAYLLEIEIPKIGYAVHKIFSQKNKEYPRTIIVEKGGHRSFILAKKQFSIIRGKGGFKDVRSALLVPQNRALNVERVVYAKIIKKTKSKALDARKEYSLIKDFSGFTGFGKAYKFFCFDKHGNYVSKQNLGIIRQEEEVRSALVIEEMDSDFNKVISQLTFNEQVSATKQLIEAINVMMRKEKVSWDLKQSNILVRRNIQLEEIKVAITDLGLARDIQRGAVRKAFVYGSPWYGAPELLYATDIVADANAHLKCEMWALGLVLYNMCFKNEFPLVDKKFSHVYSRYQHLPVVEQVAHYNLSYDEYARKLNDLIEIPLKALLLIPKETRIPKQNLEILIYRMLQLDRNIRISPSDAEEFCKEYFPQADL